MTTSKTTSITAKGMTWMIWEMAVVEVTRVMNFHTSSSNAIVDLNFDSAGEYE
jgi:hypothetical protein